MSETARPGLEVLKTAARSARLVEEAARGRIVGFINDKLCDDGGFQGRSSESDIYYTHFALAGLAALYSAPEDLSAVKQYLAAFKHSRVDDFVHFNSLLRARMIVRLFELPRLIQRGILRGSSLGKAMLSIAPEKSQLKKSGIERLEEWRSRDGGYHHARKNAERGSAYAAFLAVQIKLDYGLEIDHSEAILHSLEALRKEDGGVANTAEIPQGTTTATGAVVMLRHYLGAPEDEAMLDWLLDQYAPRGGFKAAPQAPIGDLLSTAVALLALRTAGRDLGELKESCLEFIDDLWQDDGGFCGSMADPITDVEYTLYGLMALGCLA